MHPAYLDIIGMGDKAVPLILRDLKKETSHWFIALRAITKSSPVRPEDAGLSLIHIYARSAHGLILRSGWSFLTRASRLITLNKPNCFSLSPRILLRLFHFIRRSSQSRPFFSKLLEDATRYFAPVLRPWPLGRV